LAVARQGEFRAAKVKPPYPADRALTCRGAGCACPSLVAGVQAIHPWPYRAGLAGRWVWHVRPNPRFTAMLLSLEAFTFG